MRPTPFMRAINPMIEFPDGLEPRPTNWFQKFFHKCSFCNGKHPDVVETREGYDGWFYTYYVYSHKTCLINDFEKWKANQGIESDGGKDASAHA